MYTSCCSDIFAHCYCTPPKGNFYLLFDDSNHGYPRYAHAHCHMINTLSNAYGKISLVKVLHYTCAYGTRAIGTLTSRDISPYGLDNVIIFTCFLGNKQGYLLPIGAKRWIWDILLPPGNQSEQRFCMVTALRKCKSWQGAMAWTMVVLVYVETLSSWSLHLCRKLK